MNIEAHLDADAPPRARLEGGVGIGVMGLGVSIEVLLWDVDSASHGLEAMGVEAADDQSLGPAAQGQRQLAGLVALRDGDRVGAHDRAAVDLPEALRVELRQQLAQRDPDQVLARPAVTTRTYLSAASK